MGSLNCPTCGDRIAFKATTKPSSYPGRRANQVLSAIGTCSCSPDTEYLVTKPANAIRYVVALLASRDAARFDPAVIDLQAIDDLLYKVQPKASLRFSEQGSMSTVERIKAILAARQSWIQETFNGSTEAAYDVARRLEEGLPGQSRTPAKPYRDRWRYITRIP